LGLAARWALLKEKQKLAQIYTGLGREHLIMEVKSGGLFIQLDDASRWRMGDISKTVLWLPSARVVVEKNDSDMYPYRLENLEIKEEVEAQLSG